MTCDHVNVISEPEGCLYCRLDAMTAERDNALLDVEKLEKTVGRLEEKVQHLEGTVDVLTQMKHTNL